MVNLVVDINIKNELMELNNHSCGYDFANGRKRNFILRQNVLFYTFPCLSDSVVRRMFFFVNCVMGVVFCWTCPMKRVRSACCSGRLSFASCSRNL